MDGLAGFRARSARNPARERSAQILGAIRRTVAWKRQTAVTGSLERVFSVMKMAATLCAGAHRTRKPSREMSGDSPRIRNFLFDAQVGRRRFHFPYLARCRLIGGAASLAFQPEPRVNPRSGRFGEERLPPKLPPGINLRSAALVLKKRVRL